MIKLEERPCHSLTENAQLKISHIHLSSLHPQLLFNLDFFFFQWVFASFRVNSRDYYFWNTPMQVMVQVIASFFFFLPYSDVQCGHYLKRLTCICMTSNCAAVTWLADRIIAWMSGCTGVPIKVDSEGKS